MILVYLNIFLQITFQQAKVAKAVWSAIIKIIKSDKVKVSVNPPNLEPSIQVLSECLIPSKKVLWVFIIFTSCKKILKFDF